MTGALHNSEAERGIISCMLQWPDRIPQFAELVGPEMFASPINRLLHGHLCAMSANGQGIDLVTFNNRLAKSGDLDKVGGPGATAELLADVLTWAHVDQYASIVRSLWLTRSGVETLTNAIADGQSRPEDPAAWIMSVAENLQNIGQRHSGKSRSMKELVDSAFERYEENIRQKGQLRGISTGFPILDSFTGGFQPGHFWVIAGGTSDGKSAFVEQMILAVARQGAHVALHTLEMSDDETIDRFFCQHTQVSSDSFLRGTFTREDQRALSQGMLELQALPIHIRDVSGIKHAALLADMRLLWRLHGVKLFVVDYGQLIQADARAHSREREIAEQSASLKAFAKQTKTTVIFISQLNDEGKLRESRSPGFDADKAMRLRVPRVDDDADGEFDDTRRFLHLDKNRGGQRYRKLEYRWHGPTFTFSGERDVTTSEKPKPPTKTRNTRSYNDQ